MHEIRNNNIIISFFNSNYIVGTTKNGNEENGIMAVKKGNEVYHSRQISANELGEFYSFDIRSVGKGYILK